MRVLFVYSTRDCLSARHPLASLQDIHVGLAYISAFLKARGHATQLVVVNSETPEPSREAILSAAAAFDPRVIAFTAVSTQYPFVRSAAAHLARARPGAFLLLGGVHASVRTEAVSRDVWDAVCVGEGEHATAELVAQLEAGQSPRGIPNLWLKQGDGAIEKNACRDFLQALDALPLPDRALWHPWVRPEGFAHHVIQPSRGCPYQCTYCSNHALRRMAGGKYVRFRSPQALARELAQLRKDYPGVTDVYLQSETLAVNLRWLAEFSREMRAFNESLPRPLVFTCNFRVAPRLVTNAVFDALARAGVRTIEIGLESGSERIRREVLRRDYSNEDFQRAVTLARHRGMRVNVYNLIGIPGETPADHAETVAANHRARPDRSLTSIFFPYPGTDLHQHGATQGWIREDSLLTAERKVASLDLPTFPRRDIQRAYD